MIPRWLQQAADLDDEDAGLDIIFGMFFDLFHGDKLDEANTVLAGLDRSDIKGFSTVIAVGLLSATNMAKEFLPARDPLCDVIFQVVTDRGVDAETELSGLRRSRR